ncbi:MAG: hypothetical protein ACKOAD_07760 [Gammaproteobacteria bacterium]
MKKIFLAFKLILSAALCFFVFRKMDIQAFKADLNFLSPIYMILLLILSFSQVLMVSARFFFIFQKLSAHKKTFFNIHKINTLSVLSHGFLFGYFSGFMVKMGLLLEATDLSKKKPCGSCWWIN